MENCADICEKMFVKKLKQVKVEVERNYEKYLNVRLQNNILNKPYLLFMIF